MTPEEIATKLAEIKEELENLQSAVAAMPLFLGQFHAENGLRQARTCISDCLYRLPREGKDE